MVFFFDLHYFCYTNTNIFSPSQIVPRRSGRNSGELIEETLLEEKKRRKRRSEQSADEEGAQDEDSELNEALELKPSFRMGKNEWYKILDVLEQ